MSTSDERGQEPATQAMPAAEPTRPIRRDERADAEPTVAARQGERADADAEPTVAAPQRGHDEAPATQRMAAPAAGGSTGSSPAGSSGTSSAAGAGSSSAAGAGSSPAGNWSGEPHGRSWSSEQEVPAAAYPAHRDRDFPERSSRKGSGVLAKLGSLVLAIVPWALTVAGLGVLNDWQQSAVVRLESAPVTASIGIGVLVVAGLLWVLVARLSSTGPLLAGLLTLALGASLTSIEVLTRVVDLNPLDGRYGTALTNVLYTPQIIILAGVLLLALGITAAWTRRAR